MQVVVFSAAADVAADVKHASCNAIHDATPTCCITHPHYIPPPQVNHFCEFSMESPLYKYLAHC